MAMGVLILCAFRNFTLSPWRSRGVFMKCFIKPQIPRTIVKHVLNVSKTY
jgi:hypothetical protein